MSAPPIVTLRDLAIGRGGRALARGLSLEVLPGDLVAVIGPNGSGKSTLVLTILGALPPLGGSIAFAPRTRRGAIAYVPQDDAIDPLYPFSVREVVRAATFAGLRIDPAAAEAALARVGLPRSRCRLFSSLSGGQRQRVLLARAMLGEPALFLLDEPTSAVDAASQETMVRALVARLAAARSAAFVVSHHLDALRNALTVLVRLGHAVPRCERIRNPHAAAGAPA